MKVMEGGKEGGKRVGEKKWVWGETGGERERKRER